MTPITLENFLGQEKIKERFNYLIQYYTQKEQSFPHTLLIGPHGFGKTTFAKILANEIKRKSSSPVRFEEILIGASAKGIVNVINIYGKNSHLILFIDEIHKIKNVEHIFPYMDSPNFKLTIIGATTREGNLDKPFLSRFKVIEYFREYSDKELLEILKANCEETPLSEDLLLKIVNISPSPRIALNLLTQVKILKEVSGITDDNSLFEKALYLLDLNEEGLDFRQRTYLNILKEFKEVPLKRIAALLQTTEETIETQVEPLLFKKGYITITEKGRALK